MINKLPILKLSISFGFVKRTQFRKSYMGTATLHRNLLEACILLSCNYVCPFVFLSMTHTICLGFDDFDCFCIRHKFSASIVLFRMFKSELFTLFYSVWCCRHYRKLIYSVARNIVGLALKCEACFGDRAGWLSFALLHEKLQVEYNNWTVVIL